MNDRFRERLDWVLAAVFALFLIWLAVPMAFASGDCKGQSCNQGGGDVDVDVGGDTINIGGDTITGGDVSVPVDVTGGDVSVQHKSESLGIGLSNSLGDVDIAGCLGSTQWATPLFSKQKLVVNWPCLAEFYLRNGKYQLASMAICNTEIVKEFANEAECEAAHDFAPVVAEIPTDHLRQDEIYNDQLAMVQMQISEIEDRIEQAESRPPPPPTRTIVQQSPTFTEEQKAAAWAALLGSEDEDDE
jgi:hypothetical protein